MEYILGFIIIVLVFIIYAMNFENKRLIKKNRNLVRKNHYVKNLLLDQNKIIYEKLKS
jgi:hypothetical protein